jgi:DNA polymerase IIIc chi subunit
MFRLSYSGQRTVTEDQAQTAHTLLDELLTLHASDTPVEVNTGQIRPRKDTLLLVVSLSAEADITTLKTIRDELAADLTDLDLEPDIDTAVQNIRISG